MNNNPLLPAVAIGLAIAADALGPRPQTVAASKQATALRRAAKPWQRHYPTPVISDTSAIAAWNEQVEARKREKLRRKLGNEIPEG